MKRISKKEQIRKLMQVLSLPPSNKINKNKWRVYDEKQ
jgi:hypothetical protein